MAEDGTLSPWRERIWYIIFKDDTPSAKLFDLILLIVIFASVVVVVFDSVPGVSERFHGLFLGLEILFTILFTFEYVMRLITARRPWRYMRSFFGIVDLLAILPVFLYFIGIHHLAVIRILRLLRVFRILKLGNYMSQARIITDALKASRHKIFVFLYAVTMLVIVFGGLMYVIEYETTGFESIPSSMYWAIVTLSTVGYGDITPQTPLGQLVAGVIMVLGYGLIAVPTGIVTVEMARAERSGSRICGGCGAGIRDGDAKFCKHCGTELPTA